MNKLSPLQLPKYRQLAEHFRQQVLSGVLRPGDRLPSINEMREREGISRVTMDKVHSILEQEGLIERQPGLGTFVLDQNRRAQKRAITGIIGLAGYGFRGSESSAYWAKLLEGVRTQAEAAGSQILLLPHHVSDGWEKVDGVLISDLLTAQHRNLIPAQLPLVCLFGVQPERASIVADEYSGQKLATEYLLKLGHRRIAFLHGSDGTHAPERLKGYEDALREFGIAPQKNWRRSLSTKNDFGPQFIASGRAQMAAWLGEKAAKGWNKIACTSLLCHNDETAVGAIQALHAAGLKVPGDVSVIGFDGTEVGEYSAPQLTTIEMPLRQMGQVAVEMLQKLMTNDAARAADAISIEPEMIVEHAVLPTQLLVRASTSEPHKI